MTGFGQTGPDAARAGYDLMAQGIGGFMDLTGMADGEPTRAGVPVSDIFTGVYAVVGVLAALQQRERTGKGCHVDAALVNSTVGVLANQALNFLVSGDVPKRIGNTHPNIVPYQVFEASDGYIIVATGNDRQYQEFCGVLGVPELGNDPAYKINKDRLAKRGELIGKLAPLVKKMKRDDLLAKLEARTVPAGPINNLAQVFDDPQVIHRGMKLELVSEDAVGGKIPGVRTPVMIDNAPMASPNPAPKLGQHTQQVLKEIGEA